MELGSKIVSLNTTALFLLLFGVILFSGCDGPAYKTFEQLQGYDHYSFEYPANYRLIMNKAHPYPEAVNGVAFSKIMPNGSEIILKVNNSNTFDVSKRSASTMVDKTLSVKGRTQIERKTSTVEGEACEVLTYSESDELSSYFKIAFFLHNNRAWDFGIYANSNYSERVNKDFDHLFSTFMLLPRIIKR